jgi:hypothetical protein
MTEPSVDGLQRTRLFGDNARKMVEPTPDAAGPHLLRQPMQISPDVAADIFKGGADGIPKNGNIDPKTLRDDIAKGGADGIVKKRPGPAVHVLE